MRVALGNSAKKFMNSMTTVDDMKNCIVNMAVDIKLNEIDVTIPPLSHTSAPPASNAHDFDNSYSNSYKVRNIVGLLEIFCRLLAASK